MYNVFVTVSHLNLIEFGTKHVFTVDTSGSYFCRLIEYEIVGIDLLTNLPNDIMFERDSYALFVRIEYKKIPSFYKFCKIIGHLVAQCKKKDTSVKQVNCLGKACSLSKSNVFPAPLSKSGPCKHGDEQRKTVAHMRIPTVRQKSPEKIPSDQEHVAGKEPINEATQCNSILHKGAMGDNVYGSNNDESVGMLNNHSPLSK